MNVFLTQIILATRNSEGDDTIWMQMLVLIILAVFLGIFSLVRAKANKFKEHNQDYPQDASTQASQRQRRWQIRSLHRRSAPRGLSYPAPTARLNVDKYKKIEQPVFDFNASDMAGQVKSERESAKKKEKDLCSGMELLELSFLLNTIENTSSDDERDVIIRKLNFKELLRREKLDEVDSNALKIYAVNKGNLYGKEIQCEAMRNLAERTASGSKHNS